jgi:hypothetical protein
MASGPREGRSPTNPGAMGFDEWLSHDNFFEMNPQLSRNGGRPKFEGESSEIVVDETIRFIDGRSKRQAVLRRGLVRLAARTVQRPGKDLALYDDLPKIREKPVTADLE